MVRKRCGMSSIDALTLWKWRISFVVEWTLLLENRMDSLFTDSVACLIVTSCDVDSIDEFVCEMKRSVDSIVYSYSPPITWVWERNHVNLLFLGFVISFLSWSFLYYSPRGIWNDHPDYSFSFLLIRKHSLFNPSSQTHQLNSFHFITLKQLLSNPSLWTHNSILIMWWPILRKTSDLKLLLESCSLLFSHCILCLYSIHIIDTRRPIGSTACHRILLHHLLNNWSTRNCIHYWYSDHSK